MDDSIIYNLVCHFDIDEGQLDGMPAEEAFCLGVEFGIIYRMIKTHQLMNQLMKAKNLDRVKKLCVEAKAKYSLSFMENDSTEEWVRLRVTSYGK